MYLKCHTRFKDGNEHHDYSLAEKVPCAGGRRVERHVFYLGEINDSQKEAWLQYIAAFDDQTQQQTKLALFAHGQPVPPDAVLDVLLYDLTSTYFESAPPEDPEDKRRFGYSRDKRSDCVQVVIALVVTPEGFPLAYEVLPGNTTDKTTLKPLRSDERLDFSATRPTSSQ